jgi:large subunit ribosomal protein L25
MASQFTLRPIEAKTKGAVKQLRRTGFVPVSIQHKGMPTEHYQLEAKPLEEFIRRHGEASFIDLMTVPDNAHQRAIVCGIQRDPLSQKLLQVTFQQVRSDDRVKTHIPLRFHGEPEEVKMGTFILQHSIDSLEIECAADHLPTHIDVDIANLQPGHPMRVSDLPPHPHYKILAAPDTSLASLSSTAQGKEEVAEVAEEEAPAAEEA